MWEELKGKHCKFVLKDGDGVIIFYGTVVDANEDFIAEKDRFGRLHFLSVWRHTESERG